VLALSLQWSRSEILRVACLLPAGYYSLRVRAAVLRLDLRCFLFGEWRMGMRARRRPGAKSFSGGPVCQILI
jgi:hypothetical protein